MPIDFLRRTARAIREGLQAAFARGRFVLDGLGPKRLRLLVVDEMLPDPRFGAGYPRAAQLLSAFARAGFRIVMYPVVAERSQYAAVRSCFPSSVRFLRSDGRSGVGRVVERSVGRFDAVLVSRPEPMKAFHEACAATPAFLAGTFCIYDAEAIFTIREERRELLFGTGMSEARYAQALSDEIDLTRGADAVLTVTEAEAAIFRAHVGASVHVVGHRVELQPQTVDFADRSDLLFVGRLTGAREASPNVDSLLWFVEEVMPLLDARIGSDYRLMVAGLVDDELQRRLSSPRVLLLGIVDDLASLYDRCRVFVAPTRFAAGLPLKVVEALAAGVPCVVTDLLALQLDLEEGEGIIAGGAAASFAAACGTLYRDATAWRRIRDRGRAAVGRRFSSAAFDHAVHEVFAARRPEGPQ